MAKTIVNIPFSFDVEKYAEYVRQIDPDIADYILSHTDEFLEKQVSSFKSLLKQKFTNVEE